MPKNKWKLFALSQFLADYTGDGVELFDALAGADYTESAAIFDQYAVDVWEPFENWSADDVGELIINLANQTQQTEEQTP
jgi:hypothetical protein